jgi:molybdopterin-guanine dinucleotide biosynthesis protein A
MGRTKALIEIEGVPMARRVADALHDAGCVSVVAYGGDPIELGALGLPVVPDRYPGSGPLGGVLGALELFAESEVSTAGVFVVACDLPALTGPVLADMIAAARDHPHADVVVARTPTIEPTCAIWNPVAIEPVRRWFGEGERALHVAIGRLTAIDVDLDGTSLRNINTPEDLDRYPGLRDS